MTKYGDLDVSVIDELPPGRAPVETRIIEATERMRAYELLRRRKKPGESFSQTIKEHFGRIRTGRDLERALQTVQVSEEFLDHIDEVIRSRKNSLATAAEV